MLLILVVCFCHLLCFSLFSLLYGWKKGTNFKLDFRPKRTQRINKRKWENITGSFLLHSASSSFICSALYPHFCFHVLLPACCCCGCCCCWERRGICWVLWLDDRKGGAFMCFGFVLEVFFCCCWEGAFSDFLGLFFWVLWLISVWFWASLEWNGYCWELALCWSFVVEKFGLMKRCDLCWVFSAWW